MESDVDDFSIRTIGSSGKINSLMFDKLEEQFTKTSTTEYLCDSGGGTAVGSGNHH